ncbi:hypothetical protein A3715_11420 [Oleiphilus sp. HI0009]|nr:hypothetical protein A3715_11420 [Oleiphilus sp. HI0009]
MIKKNDLSAAILFMVIMGPVIAFSGHFLGWFDRYEPVQNISGSTGENKLSEVLQKYGVDSIEYEGRSYLITVQGKEYDAGSLSKDFEGVFPSTPIFDVERAGTGYAIKLHNRNKQAPSELNTYINEFSENVIYWLNKSGIDPIKLNS